MEVEVTSEEKWLILSFLQHELSRTTRIPREFFDYIANYTYEELKELRRSELNEIFNELKLITINKKKSNTKLLPDRIYNTLHDELNEIRASKILKKLKNGYTLFNIDEIKVRLICYDNPQYPRLLKLIDDPPACLFVYGKLEAFPRLMVAIVGTRNPSVYARHKTLEIGEELAKRKVTIVSGLAQGIDEFAHTAALKYHNTIAVLGGGFTHIYPKEHQELAKDIVTNGLLISEYPPDTKAKKDFFLARNRIIAGLTVASIIIEGNNISGTKSQANYTLKYNRLLFALTPKNKNRLTAKLPLDLINKGDAIGITTVEDILPLINLNE